MAQKTNKKDAGAANLDARGKVPAPAWTEAVLDHLDKYRILVIGDPHYDEKRKKSIATAEESIFQVLETEFKQKKVGFDICVITGDIYNETPTVEERVMFATFLNRLRKRVGNMILIKGTDTHEFTKGFYNMEDIILLSNIQAYEEIEIVDFVFGHYEVKGTKYVNGFESKSERVIDPKKTYMLGHIHSPQCSFDKVHYVGSIYKNDFAERNDQKRIAIIDRGTLQWFPIQSRPMHQIKLVGKDGGVKVDKETKEFLQNTPEKSEMDLKIVVDTDAQSLGAIDRQIAKIKEKFSIEYYVQEKNIREVKVDVPQNLNQDYLFETYVKAKNVPLELALKEYKA
jgi:DNA repair exonuclease SbcCD nuclease subunit